MNEKKEAFLLQLLNDVQKFDWKKDESSDYPGYSTMVKGAGTIRVFQNMNSDGFAVINKNVLQVFVGCTCGVGICVDSLESDLVNELFIKIEEVVSKKTENDKWAHAYKAFFG